MKAWRCVCCGGSHADYVNIVARCNTATRPRTYVYTYGTNQRYVNVGCWPLNFQNRLTAGHEVKLRIDRFANRGTVAGMMDSRFSRSGGALRGLVMVLCLGFLAYLAWMLTLPANLREKEAARAVDSLSNTGSLAFGLLVLVIAVLTILMPWFAYVAATEATKARRVAERIEELLRAPGRVESGHAWQETPAEMEDAPTIYPVKTPPKVTRIR